MMDFPAEPVLLIVSPPAGLLGALCVRAVAVTRNRLDYLVELADEAAVRAVRPDFAWLSSIETRGVIVTTGTAGAGYDFVSRFFAPSARIAE